jgi:prepilin-type N-terminal cleavage/methylation domain-containing protein
MRTKGGFTIIELLLTVVILGILTAVAIPGFSTWAPDYRLRGAVRVLKSDMELAKQRAIREGANVALTLDEANNTYTVFVDNGAGGGVAGDWILNGSELVIKTVMIHPHVTMYEASFAGGAPHFRFDARGLPNGTGGHVYMRNTKNNYRGIRVNMLGRVRIESSSDGGASWQPVG